MPHAVSASSDVHDDAREITGQRAGGGTERGAAPLTESGGKDDIPRTYAPLVPRPRGVDASSIEGAHAPARDGTNRRRSVALGASTLRRIEALAVNFLGQDAVSIRRGGRSTLGSLSTIGPQSFRRGQVRRDR